MIKLTIRANIETAFVFLTLKIRSMIDSLRFFSKMLLLLLFGFFLQRGVFVAYQVYNTSAVSFAEYLQSNLHAFVLDMAASAYVLGILFLIWLSGMISRKRFFAPIAWWFMVFIVPVVTFIHVVDLGLYVEWGSKINHKAIACLAYPKQALAATLSSPVWLLLVLWAAESALILYVYKKWIHPLPLPVGGVACKIVVPLLLAGLLFVGSRGGIQPKPVRKGDVYFSNNPMINQASANSFWNFINVLASPDANNPKAYRYTTDAMAREIVGNLTEASGDSVTRLFTLPKPNFVVVMLESFSAEVVGAYGAPYGATPILDSLAANGLICSDFYATGFRTDQGLIAIETGFPAQPKTAVMNRYGKFEKLPSLASILVEAGYSTAFYSAGDNSFANTDAFLLSAGYQLISGQEKMSITRRALFGGYDDELFSFYLSERRQPEPFYNILVTIVSHEPFDAEVPRFREGSTLLDKYINTVHFTDAAITGFLKKAKTQAWFKNTVFVFLGDHAHRLPAGRKAWEPERHHIPFIVFGEPLKREFRGVVWRKTACQTDFPDFIAGQTGIGADKFVWGKDFMDWGVPSVAFYTFDDGIGFVSADTSLVYDNTSGRVIRSSFPGKADSISQAALKAARAVLQKITSDYDALGD